MGNKLSRVSDEILNNEELIERIKRGEVEEVIKEVQEKLKVKLSNVELALLRKNLNPIKGK